MIRTVGVVGAGTMGNGIAQVFAQSGFTVLLHDATPGAVARARATIEKSLAKFVEKGKLGGDARDAALARITPATSLDDLSSALDVVTERQLWQNLRTAGHTVVATSYKRSALELADKIVLLRHGRVEAIGSLPELERPYGHLFA